MHAHCLLLHYASNLCLQRDLYSYNFIVFSHAFALSYPGSSLIMCQIQTTHLGNVSSDPTIYDTFMPSRAQIMKKKLESLCVVVRTKSPKGVCVPFIWLFVVSM